MDLQQENQELKKKLEVAQSWMQKEIQNQILAISKKHLLEKSENSSTQLLTTEMDDIIVQKILGFFSDTPLTNIPEDMIEHLTKSEIQYYLLQK